MSEADKGGSQEVQSQSEAELYRAVRDTTPPHDFELEKLVALINAWDATEIGVTLHVQGCVVSGMLVSARLFYTLFIDSIGAAKSLGGEPAQNLSVFADFFQSTLENYKSAISIYQHTGELPPQPRYIHIRHALTYMSGAQPLGPSLWRGRLSKIDGWSLGNYGNVPRLAPELLG